MFDPVIEQERIRAHLVPLHPALNYLLNPDNFSPEELQLIQTAIASGIMLGLRGAVQSMLSDQELDFSGAVPDTVEELFQ